MKFTKRSSRRGVSMVLVGMSLSALVGFLAMSIDLGMIASARTQVATAADAAAMAGSRALNSTTGARGLTSTAVLGTGSDGLILQTARDAAKANTVLGTAITDSQVTVNVGRYTYDSTNTRFQGVFTGSNTENWTMVQAKVVADVGNSLTFWRVFRIGSTNLTSVSAAAHRPRDVAVILDLSGSMHYSSLTGLMFAANRGASNNPDTIYPKFGPYGTLIGSSFPLQAASAGGGPVGTHITTYGSANITNTITDAGQSNGRAPIVNDFYQSVNYGVSPATGTVAFSAAGVGDTDAFVAGDKPLPNKTAGTGYAQTLSQAIFVSGATNAQKNTAISSYQNTASTGGYKSAGASSTFSGYTQGPGYYGKTFFIWPPDPTTNADGVTNDWRQRYFLRGDSASIRADDNTWFWDTAAGNIGTWKIPGTTSTSYKIDYSAIWKFIIASPNPFPTKLQAGKIVYYDFSAGGFPSAWSSLSDATPTNAKNLSFWTDYINYVLGVRQAGTPPSGSYTLITAKTGYGDDFVWGTAKISAKPTSGPFGTAIPLVDIDDNPKRPRLHFWFGPLTMVDFLGNHNLTVDSSINAAKFTWWPGTCHEAPLYLCKLGIQAAIGDFQRNHPNDFLSMITFSTPKIQSEAVANPPTGLGRFNRVRYPLSLDYQNITDSIWYPPSTVVGTNTTVTPYANDNVDVPRAMGETCYQYPLMLAFNQFSSNTTSALQGYYTGTGVPTGDTGGNGRKGAQKLLIFETDGAPNIDIGSVPTVVNGGSGAGYYPIRFNPTTPAGSEYVTAATSTGDNNSTVQTQITTICDKLKTEYDPNNRNKLKLHCISFGSTIDSTAKGFLDTGMQQRCNVYDGMPSYKIIAINDSTALNLQKALTAILQDFVQVSLIQ